MSNRRRHLSPEQVERMRQVLDLRLAGLSYNVIAERVGYATASGAKRCYDRALALTLQPSADALRETQLARLERLHAAQWPRALRGEWRAVQAILKIAEREANLMGLDHAHGIAERQQEALERYVNEVAGLINRLEARLRAALPEQAEIIGEVIDAELVTELRNALPAGTDEGDDS